MRIRKPKECEKDSVYLMGKDAWGSDSSEWNYLDDCRTSKKYQLGVWFCLEQNNRLVSQIIFYQGLHRRR